MKPEILTHFSQRDPVLVTIWKQLRPEQQAQVTVRERPVLEFFGDLVDAIVSQQLSLKAGNTILKRLLAEFPGARITPELILQKSDEQLRTVGLSRAKVAYLKSLATEIVTKNLRLELLPTLSNEEVIQELIKVKGIGVWTAEMFLMFSLGREDIFSLGDLGLRNALKRWYHLEEITPEVVQKITVPWSPYRTYAARILWQSLELKREADLLLNT